jgi:peptidyl-prolyl cis-trans isomerase A (cyclophilin A)
VEGYTGISAKLFPSKRGLVPGRLLAALLLCQIFLTPVFCAAAQTSQSKAHVPVKTPAKAPQPALPPVELPAEPGLYAVIYTSMGNIVCLLYDKSAPQTVANFRGLALGTKPWKDLKTGRMHHTALYSGTTFHRVIPGFMIQGGDPAGDGTGEPGYKVPDEIDPTLNFGQAGVLAMANSGPNTNGCQFFITVGAAEHLNGNYSIFGRVVAGQEVADSISNVPRDESNDKPKTAVIIKAIAIRTVSAEAAKKPATE